MVDSAAAIAIKEQRIDLVIVGADRIATNGDIANKIGTYALAILAAHHGIPFYVAAPRSTFDFAFAAARRYPSKSVRRKRSRRLAGCRLPSKARPSTIQPST